MAKLFSLASWNVEHFKNKPDRVSRVVSFLKKQDPDVFALYEVEGKEVFSELVKRMPKYNFHITEGPQVQEILVGVRHGLTAFFTQRVDFKSGIQTLRPGALLTLSLGGKNYTLLFLHTKSGSNPLGLGIRDDMFSRAIKLKKKLDKAAGGSGKANFLFLGDLNTMGMRYPFKKGIDAPFEIKRLGTRAKAQSAGMRHLLKDRDFTWWNGSNGSYDPSDLDHVVASQHLPFRQWTGKPVNVRGWPALATTAQKDAWIGTHSDHGMLYLEVLK